MVACFLDADLDYCVPVVVVVVVVVVYLGSIPDVDPFATCEAFLGDSPCAGGP